MARRSLSGRIKVRNLTRKPSLAPLSELSQPDRRIGPHCVNYRPSGSATSRVAVRSEIADTRLSYLKYYPIWAIRAARASRIIHNLGESVARCYLVVAIRRRGWSQAAVIDRTTLRWVSVVQPVFTSFESARKYSEPTRTSLILPDICARISERIFFAPMTPRDGWLPSARAGRLSDCMRDALRLRLPTDPGEDRS